MAVTAQFLGLLTMGTKFSNNSVIFSLLMPIYRHRQRTAALVIYGNDRKCGIKASVKGMRARYLINWHLIIDEIHWLVHI